MKGGPNYTVKLVGGSAKTKYRLASKDIDCGLLVSMFSVNLAGVVGFLVGWNNRSSRHALVTMCITIGSCYRVVRARGVLKPWSSSILSKGGYIST